MKAAKTARLPSPATLRRELLALARERGTEKTFCPSELARLLAPATWRPLMPVIREAAASLVLEKRLRATQRGREIDPVAARGPIRLSAAERAPHP